MTFVPREFEGVWSGNQRSPVDVQVFNTPSTVNGNQWHVWRRPRNASMLYVWMCDAGGGGGGGRVGDGGVSKGGGGGGGSGATSWALYPIFLLPDTLYAQVGLGGAGGAGGPPNNADGTAGTAGGITLLAVDTEQAQTIGSMTPSCYLLRAGGGTPNGSGIGGGGGGGGGGVSGAGGAAGAAGTVGTLAGYTYGTTGLQRNQAGVAGAAGATGDVAGNNVTLVRNSAVTGGGGGAGHNLFDQNGGGFATNTGAYINALYPAQDVTNPLGGGWRASNGYTLWQPFFNFGGCGGTSAGTTTGADGGDGAYGSGGGGGGAGTNPNRAGNGGRGGDGLVIMVSW